jgi:hypothetical protein
MTKKNTSIKKRDYEYQKLANGGLIVKLGKGKFDSFGPSNLGLGDLRIESTPTDSIAAVFDLAGFTNFCKQIEPHLSVPIFLNNFLDWLFDEIKSQLRNEEDGDNVKLWCPLPFYTKFMGDGLLVLWDVSSISEANRLNIIVACLNICKQYKKDFYPRLRKIVSEPPTILRCGLARGTVLSVGNGSDYVGSCINMAARLQKINGATFAFNRRGINLERDTAVVKRIKASLVIAEVDVRGIGEHELVAILKTEYNELSDESKALFKVLD